MIKFEKFILNNGLKVIFHQDKDTPIAAVNMLYDVGAKDEHPQKTGFAHLFEHLMFGGSVNIPNYDKPLQEAGGSSNAFTNNDFTNYYETLPKDNLETALWLESDRMLSLAFTDKSLEVQRKVVIEEFKQNYLNRPYGDFWLLMRPLAYKIHPYSWATIGKEISHIENATIQDVKDFFYSHYAPNNAVLSIAGNFEFEYIKDVVEKWFGNIEKRTVAKRNIPEEPKQTEAGILTVERNVPVDAWYQTYHMCGRKHPDFYAADLLSDILSNGESSRLFQKLIKKNPVFSSLDAYISGSIDPGLFIFNGKPSKGVSLEEAESAVLNELENLLKDGISNRELQKVKNKIESRFIFSETDVLNKATDLAFYELLEDAETLNYETQKYNKVTIENILETANRIFKKENSNTLYY
ncbi:MAG: insulinase family protein, partial [Bacteroidales bacterium]|nr:insulinase family protein [Bacteroidales bacterium]